MYCFCLGISCSSNFYRPLLCRDHLYTRMQKQGLMDVGLYLKVPFQCWTRIQVIAEYQFTTSMMELKNLPNWHQNFNTHQIVILGGYYKRESYAYSSHYLGQYHPKIILILGQFYLVVKVLEGYTEPNGITRRFTCLTV